MAEYNESQINSNETERIASEQQRIENEAKRQTKETEREAREATRQSNESTRISKEAEREEEHNRKIEEIDALIDELKSGSSGSSEYAHSHTNKVVLDGITANKVTAWDNKSDFNGDYNSLTNKPNIPSIEGLATENYVKNEIANAQLGGGDTEIDLSGYATKDYVDNAIDEIELQKGDKGDKGEDGITPNISIGSVTVLEAGQKATVTRRGADATPIFDFGIPKGDKGEDGLSYDDTELRDSISTLTNNKADKTEIPTKVSQLTNDSNFLTSIPNEYVTKDELNDALENNGNGSAFKLSDFTVSNSDVIRQSENTYYVDVLATQGHLVRCNLDSSRKLFLFKAERGMYWITLGSDTSNTYTTIVAIGDAQPGKVVIMNNSSNSIHKVIRNQSNNHVNTGASYSVGSTVELQLTDSKLIITINNITYMEVPFSLITGNDTQYIATKHLGFYLNISAAEVYNNNPTIFLSNPSYNKSVNVDLSEYVKRSELNALISQINALRSDVDRLLQNNGGEDGGEVLYYNPTMSIENDRAVFKENGHEEKFLITHVENKNDPNYRGSVQIKGSDGYDYFVLLTDNAESTNSKFRYNNLIPSHGGWRSDQNKAGAEYPFVPDRTYPYRNNFNFTDTVENVDNSVNSDLLNKVLEHFNNFFPAVNMQVATSSKNKIRQQSVSDGWWGAHYPYGSYFDIIINERPIKSYAGAYGAGKYEYSDRGCWIHTVLHEFSHCLGLKDQPKHEPSLFNYDASYEQLAGELFLQPNDFCALNYFYKKHYNLDITPETTQEDINNQLAQNAQVATFANELDSREVEDDELFMDFSYPTFDTTDMKVEVSDVVVRCKLKFDKEEKIQITKNELNNLSLRYNVFTIEPLETFKGELVNNKLKIHISENMNIDENTEYLTYLMNFEDVPCSLINPRQGLEKL